VNLQVKDVVNYFNDNSNYVTIQIILKGEEMEYNSSHFSEAAATLHNFYVSFDILKCDAGASYKAKIMRLAKGTAGRR
jgi:hypothetical protein